MSVGDVICDATRIIAGVDFYFIISEVLGFDAFYYVADDDMGFQNSGTGKYLKIYKVIDDDSGTKKLEHVDLLSENSASLN